MKCPKCQSDNTDTARFCSNCATPLPLEDAQVSFTKTMETPVEKLTRGVLFANRYEIIEELGIGGMGAVYRVYDTKTEEEIALKLIRPEIAADKKTIDRFRSELTTARRIAHRNVCKMYDLGEDKGNNFITMEYVSGGDLKKFIRRSEQLSVGKAISIAKQICDGLSEAHSLGIVHRDLKPNNIMIDDSGNAKIMDFGIARSIKAKGITGAGVMIGTPEYMSPEQVEGKEVDQRSDIYSLGVILYEMVTGGVPFEGDTPFTIGVKHKSEAPRNPKELNSQIPDDLSNLILKCMEKDKDNRCQTAGDLNSELDNIEKGIPTTDRVILKKKPITSKEITVTFRAKRLVIPTLVIIAITIIGLFLWHPWSRTETPLEQMDKPSVAVLPFEDLSPQKNQEHLCLGIATELIHRLNRVQDLWVPARASSFSFWGETINIQEIGNKLDVKTVLVGTLQKASKRLRILVELVNVADNHTIWQETYQREEGDIFNLQDEISLSVLDSLKVKLLGEERANFVKRYTENNEAHDLYLLGRHFWYKRNEEGFNNALTYLEQAVEKDPEFALAYAGLADAYNMLATYNLLSPLEAYPKAEKAAKIALKIDDELSEAYTALAWIKHWYYWDLEGAASAYKHAILLNPRYVHAHSWYGWCLVTMGRYEEAISEVKKAHELDPLSIIINADMGRAYFYANQYDQAIEHLKKALELDNNFSRAHAWLGEAYLQKKYYEKAIEEFKTAIKTSGENPTYIASLCRAYVEAEKKDEAFKILASLEEISKNRFVAITDFASVYVSLGEIDKSLDLLEQAYSERSNYIIMLTSNPMWENLRSNSRFKALLKKVGLELPKIK